MMRKATAKTTMPSARVDDGIDDVGQVDAHLFASCVVVVAAVD